MACETSVLPASHLGGTGMSATMSNFSSSPTQPRADRQIGELDLQPLVIDAAVLHAEGDDRLLPQLGGHFTAQQHRQLVEHRSRM